MIVRLRVQISREQTIFHTFLNHGRAVLFAIAELNVKHALRCQYVQYLHVYSVIFGTILNKSELIVMKFAHCCVAKSDGRHMLVDEYSYPLFTSGLPGTIPCRPTHPNVTVTLIKSAVSDEAVPLDDNVVFQLHTGFLIRRTTPYFDGYFKCLASLDGVTSQQSVIITYKGK